MLDVPSSIDKINMKHTVSWLRNDWATRESIVKLIGQEIFMKQNHKMINSVSEQKM